MGTPAAKDTIGESVFLSLVFLITAWGLGYLIVEGLHHKAKKRFAIISLLVLIFIEMGTLSSNVPKINSYSTGRNAKEWFKELKLIDPLLARG